LRPGSAIKRKIKPVPQAAAQKQQVNNNFLLADYFSINTLGRVKTARRQPLFEKKRLHCSSDTARLR